MFEKAALVGIGLIGSSIARAMKRDDLAREISVCDKSQHSLDQARALDLGTSYATDPAVAVEGADLVILCTPVGAFGAVAAQISHCLAPDAILTDVGSVKEYVVKVIGDVMPEYAGFVPGHPISGSERSGPTAGHADLFRNRWCVLTPTPYSSPAAVEKMKTFWTLAGGNVELMDPGHHDLVLAITSHLPHLIAYNIVGTADHLESVTKSEVIKYSAGGFRDFTRIAASDPVMWRDVFLTNRDAVMEMLGRFAEDLSMLQRAVRFGDGKMLEDLFTRTRNIRRSIIDAGQEIDAPDFGRQASVSELVKQPGKRK